MTPNYATLSILVIDDSRDMRTIIGSVLAAIGVTRLKFASGGAAGLMAIAEQDFDVIFVDQEMPGVRGIEVIRAVRGRTDAKRFLPIIMLTGHADLRHLVGARDAGVNEFLRKPVTARSIVERLLAVIHRPRDFVRTPTYFGPDRRRTCGVDGDSPELGRRKGDPKEILVLSPS